MKFSLLILISISLSLVSCRFGGVRGNGEVISETREIEDFNKIDISGNYEVHIQMDDENKMEVFAESNLMKYIHTYVKGNTLYITSKKNLKPRKDLIIKLMCKELNSIDCSGVNDIIASDIRSDYFKIDLSGAGSIKIDGEANRLKIDVSGAADLDARNFITKSVNIDVSGAANASIYASESCNAEVSGAGYIELYGDAKDVSTDISGAGSLTRKD